MTAALDSLCRPGLRMLHGVRFEDQETQKVEAIPIASDGSILPGHSVIMYATPKVVFRPFEFFISNVGSPGGSSDWSVVIRLDGQQVITQAHGPMVVDIAFQSIPWPFTRIEVEATYIGPNTQGAPFFSVIRGMRIDDKATTYVGLDDALYQINTRDGYFHSVAVLKPTPEELREGRVVEIRHRDDDCLVWMYALDERTGRVVFELSLEATALPASLAIRVNWVPEGYLPTWLEARE